MIGQSLKNNSQLFYNWFLRIVTFDFLSLDVYSQNQCKIFLFLFHSMDLVSQLQTCFGIATNFVNGVLFLPCI
jgi:hypothetical protein